MTGSRARILETGVLVGAFVGAVLLTVAELTTLYTIHIATSRRAISSEGTGSHNGYAMIPIAALALLLAAGLWRRSSRISLTAIAVLGIGALVLALVRDLPDAQSQGLVLSHGDYHLAKASASAGLYMETLGAVVLIITGGCGLQMAGLLRRPKG
jgi:hypothetical protein